MPFTEPGSRRRIAALAAAAFLQLVIGYALVTGLAVDFPARVAASLRLIAIAPEPRKPPPDPVVPRQTTPKRPAAAAAPPNRRSRATPIVVPAPVIPLTLPPPVVAAPVAGTAADAAAGAAETPGPGSGAGGEGDGSGSGRDGDGDGGGGSPARFLRGGIGNGDVPRRVYLAGLGGTVRVRYTVGTDGRVHDCAVTQSSGVAELDETTCRLLTRRLRFEPARDGAGRKVPEVQSGRQVWEVDRRERVVPPDSGPQG